MPKFAFVAAVLAALAASTPASGALLAKSCGNRCATLTASGTGSLGVVGSGAEWGSFRSGTVWVRDRTGKSNPRNWVHGTDLQWKTIGEDGWKATTSKSVTFGASGKFWIKLVATKIQMSGVFDGAGSINGTGTYNLNGHKRSWPNATTTLKF